MGYRHICVAVILLCGLVATSTGDSLPFIDEKVLHDAWAKGESSLEREMSMTVSDNKYSERSGSAYGQRSPKIARQETVQVWKRAEVFARAVDHVCETQNVTRPVGERLVERAAPRGGLDPNVLCRGRSISCNQRLKYRRIDGSCNNIRNPEWGMAVSRLARLVDPAYGDGFNSFRQSSRRGGGDLPLARVVSTNLVLERQAEDNRWTHMLMFWGQFLNHDLTSTPHRTDLDKCCSDHRGNADCVPIPIPPTDVQLGPFQIGCMEFARSHRACGNGARQQMNQNTAFIDCSQVYGSTDSEANSLRLFQRGLLKFSRGLNNEVLPPQNASDQTCVKPQGQQFANMNCFIGGDNRANENPGLSSMHVIFLREHNRIADALVSLRGYDDETAYQEARRIVIAQAQNIFYDEFLPTILSQSTMREFALGLPEAGAFTDYDANIDPTTINSFSTAAYRFGHSIIQGSMSTGNGRSIDLPSHFNNPTSIYQTGAEGLLVGATTQRAQKMDNLVTQAVTRQLFREGNNRFGMDLAALNIQRGRDHGLPGYNAFRRRCRLPAASSEQDLRNFFIDSDAAAAFMGTYGQIVEDIDLWPAGIAEKPKEEGMLGPTFSCILGVQFNRLKWGDRFFFTHRNQAGSFTQQQLTQLRRRTLASIICENARPDSIQPQLNVFKTVGSGNPSTHCRNQPQLNLRIF